MMKPELPYPFSIEFMKRNKAFLLFCPPDCLDEHGRPVLEGRSMRHRPDPGAYQRCPYPDSRSNADKPINVESLQALLRQHDVVVAFIDDIARCLRSHAIVAAGSADLAALYAVSYIGYKSPQIFFMQKMLGEPVEVPAVCAIASRFFHGLVNILALMALDHEGSLQGHELTAEDIYRYANRNKHLIGKNESCAASGATIIRYITTARQSCSDSGASDLAGHYSGTLPASMVETVCHAARITAELELCCLIYETVRRWLWRQMPADHIGQEPPPTFATPHCLVAKKISLASQPFDHLLFRRAYHLAQPLLINPTRIDEMLRDAIAIINICQGTPTDAQRSLIKAAIRALLDSHAGFLSQQVKPGECFTADLDVFFGHWPAL
ncbi:hypothetical protein [Burkholderia multivorans]|uniref:hypothetical protein n=1 Tax=Burkholderia multivorans TaxID=87883 RepID=UPI00027820A2|nr:hypothetical protein [Burkholderia multivorans]EJO53897.1 hypothetical protein BURMUCF2_A1989 [Burkholderia multivorans CF2]MBU9474634.1 hypothetical protein [Burkholderia multivorans]